MDGIPWPVVGTGTGWTVAVMFVVFLITGRLIPKSTHERELEAAQHDGQEWRTEGRLKDAQIAEKDRQLGHLSEVGRTVNAIMRTLQRGNGAPVTGEDP